MPWRKINLSVAKDASRDDRGGNVQKEKVRQRAIQVSSMFGLCYTHAFTSSHQMVETATLTLD